MSDCPGCNAWREAHHLVVQKLHDHMEAAGEIGFVVLTQRDYIAELERRLAAATAGGSNT